MFKRRKADEADDHVILAMPGIVRVQEERGSHIEPKYDQGWPEDVRLSWLLGVVEADYGLHATLYDSHYTINGKWVRPIHYGVSIPGVSLSRGDFHDTWRTLHDLGQGYALGLKQASSSI